MATADALSAKALRLVRPNFFQDTPAVVEDLELLPHNGSLKVLNELGSSVDPGQSFYGQDIFSLKSSLCLEGTASQSVFMGTSYSAYVSITNHTIHPVEDVIVRIELAVDGGMQYTLIDTKAAPHKTLAGRASLDFIVSHRISFCQGHSLNVTFSYREGESRRTSSSKLDHFTGVDPLEVAYKATLTSSVDNMFLEAQVSNTSKSPLVLAEVKFIVTDSLKQRVAVEEYGSSLPFLRYHPRKPTGSEINFDEEEKKFFDSLARDADAATIGTGDIRQYLYRLSLPSEIVEEQTGVDFEVGYLSIRWRNGLGEAVTFATKPVLWKQAQGVLESEVVASHGKSPKDRSLEFTLVSVPVSIVRETPFVVSLMIRSREEVELDLSVEKSQSGQKSGAIYLNGVLKESVGRVPPKGSAVVTLNLFAALPGVQGLHSLELVDLNSHRRFEIPSHITVLVT